LKFNGKDPNGIMSPNFYVTGKATPEKNPTPPLPTTPQRIKTIPGKDYRN